MKPAKELTTTTVDKAKLRADFFLTFEGMNISDISELFGVDKKKAYQAAAKIKPSGERPAGTPIYRVKDIAPYLVKPLVDVEEYIKKLRPNDLPPFLQTEFWKGQNERLKFQENARELWRTERVQQAMALVFKLIRQTLAVMDDTVARQTGLTSEQTKLIRALLDSLLGEVRDAIVEEFKQWSNEADQQALILDMNTVLGTEIDLTEDEDRGL